MLSKVILVPDSFKGTLSSQQVCEIMGRVIRKINPETEIISIPVADGGEGTVDAFLAACGGTRKPVRVKGPFLEEMESFYGMLEDGTAIIEMAACAGLPLAEGRLDPACASTYGVGQLMLDAAASGSKKIILGLGGSCTNDGGAGAAAAAGVKFFRKDGSEFLPTGKTLEEIFRVDVSELKKRFQGVSITAMCDIDNPLYGESGAAYVFGPQKGAGPAMVELLDRNLRTLASVVQNDLQLDFAEVPGAGAAGGMGFGMSVFFGASLQMGINTVLDTAGFVKQLIGADLVFSGEGRIDSQSVRGKVLSGVAKRTKLAQVPLIALVGQIGEGFEPLYEEGLSAVFSINRAAVPFSESRLHAEENLALAAENVLRLLDAVKI